MSKLVSLIILITLMVWATAPVHAQSEATVATIEPLQGLVQWLPAGEADWQVLIQPTQINAGDQIRTGEYGWALLTFFEGAFTEILANTELTINELELPEDEGESFAISLGLAIGDTFSTVDAVLDSESRFEIEMPGMTASVRGTEWYSRVVSTGCSMVYVEEGEVTTAGVLNENNPVYVNPGEYIVYNHDGTIDNVLQPTFPAPRPDNVVVAPDTCGNDICEFGEFGVCDLDCAVSMPNCGDHICQASEGEGLLTCNVDCGSLMDLTEEEIQQRLEANHQ
jgi:FecR protein